MADVIAERYSQALFDLAKEKDMLQKTEEDVLFIKSLMDEHPELYRYLQLPDVSIDRKKTAMERILEGSVSRPVAGLLQLLIQKSRIAYLDEIFAEFQNLVRIEKKQMQVQITSASALSPEELSKITKTLEQSLHKEILAEQIVDPSLIGGIVVRVGDKIYDNSIRSSLDRLSRHLKGFRILDDNKGGVVQA